MYGAGHRYDVYLTLALILLLLPRAVQAQATFPSVEEVARTSVSLEIEGFVFASGLQRTLPGKVNGKGMEVIHAVPWCGSGFVIDRAGTIVTNYHVARRALKGRARFPNGTRYDITHITAVDPRNDLALLKLNTSDTVPAVGLGNSESVNLRDEVLAVGYPSVSPMEKCQNLAVTEGKISQILRESRSGEMQFFRHSAPIAPGSSGGPLYKGATVVGINTRGWPGWQFYEAIPVKKLSPLIARQKPLGLHEAFPHDVPAIEKRSTKIDGTLGQLDPGLPDKPGLQAFLTRLPALQDIVIVLKSPGYDLDLLIRQKDGELVGYGGAPQKDREVVFISTQQEQVVEIVAVNVHPETVRFGLDIYGIVWLRE